jgi:hypothetical protein
VITYVARGVTCALDGARSVPTECIGAVEAAADRSGGIALAHAAERTHAATERAAERSAQSATGVPAKNLCVQGRGAADEREHRDRLDQVFVVHVFAPELLVCVPRDIRSSQEVLRPSRAVSSLAARKKRI